MDAKALTDQWPEDLLEKHPVREVVICGRKTQPPLFSYAVTFPRLEIPLKGCYENQVEKDGRVVTLGLKPGSVLFVPPNCWNFPTWRTKVEVMSVLFGKKQIGVSVVKANGSSKPHLLASKFAMPQPMGGPVPHILYALLELHAVGHPQSAFPELTRALLSCVGRLTHEAPATGLEGRGQGFFERVCVYLQSHYQYDITRDSVAHQFGVTPNHLSRVFHAHGHMTFIKYLTHVRIARSKYLLCNYHLKLEEIGARCGFRDAPYFCRVFKRITRATPAEYRAKMLQQVRTVAA